MYVTEGFAGVINCIFHPMAHGSMSCHGRRTHTPFRCNGCSSTVRKSSIKIPFLIIVAHLDRDEQRYYALARTHAQHVVDVVHRSLFRGYNVLWEVNVLSSCPVDYIQHIQQLITK